MINYLFRKLNPFKKYDEDKNKNKENEKEKMNVTVKVKVFDYNSLFDYLNFFSFWLNIIYLEFGKRENIN